MKTLVQKIVFAVLLGCVCFAAQAGNGKKGKDATDMKMPYSAAINLHRGNVVAVQFTKPSAQKVTVTIKDQNGKVIKYERLQKHDIMVKKYALADFPKGSYQVEVSNGRQTLQKAITLE